MSKTLKWSMISVMVLERRTPLYDYGINRTGASSIRWKY